MSPPSRRPSSRPAWARRAAHRCGQIAKTHADPGSDAAHHEMTNAILEEFNSVL